MTPFPLYENDDQERLYRLAVERKEMERVNEMRLSLLAKKHSAGLTPEEEVRLAEAQENITRLIPAATEADYAALAALQKRVSAIKARQDELRAVSVSMGDDDT